MKTLFQLSVLLLFLSCCKRDDDFKPDPCEGVKSIAAKFEMRETTINPNFSYFEFKHTNISMGGYIHFKAVEEDASEYIWQVGNEPNTRSGREFELSFTDHLWNQGGEPIEVTLTVIKQSNPCFPEDTIKTTSQTLSFQKTSLVDGKFLGRFEHESLDRTIEIRTNGEVWDRVNQDYRKGIMFVGLPLLDTISLTNDYISSIWHAGFDFNISHAGEDKNGVVRGAFTLEDDKKTLTGYYQVYVGEWWKEENIVEYKFKGQLIQ